VAAKNLGKFDRNSEISIYPPNKPWMNIFKHPFGKNIKNCMRR